MTDDNHSGDDFIRRALSAETDPPADTVPHHQGRMDPVDAVRLLGTPGRGVTFVRPGELTVDADGAPLAVTAPTEIDAMFMCSPQALGYTAEELRQFGYNPEGDDDDA